MGYAYRVAAVVCAGALLGPVVSSAEEIDGFSGGTLDFNAWGSVLQESAGQTVVREPVYEIVRDVDVGQGRLNLGLSAPGDNELRQSRLFVRDPEAESLQGTLRVSASDVSGQDAVAGVRIAGVYYNAQRDATQDDPENNPGQTGEVFAAVTLGDYGRGLEGWYIVEESDNADFSAVSRRAFGVLVPPGELSLGQAVDAGIEYLGDNQFVFTLDGRTEQVTVSEAPRQGAAAVPFQSFDAFGQSDGAPVSVLGSAADPVVNGGTAPFDSFTEARLDPEGWSRNPADGIYLARVRAAEDGELRLDVQGEDLTDGFAGRSLEQVEAPLGGADAFQAETAIVSTSELDPGVEGRASIMATLYNSGQADAGGSGAGDVLAELWLSLQDGVVQATAYAGLLDGAGGFTNIDVEPFAGVALEQDTAYTLSVELDEEAGAIVYSVDDRSTTLAIPADHELAPADDSFGAVRSQVRDDNGSGGILRATFDDVRTSPLSVDDGAGGDNGGSGTGTGGGSGSGGSSSSGGCSVAGGGGGAGVPALAAIALLLWHLLRRSRLNG